MAHEKIKLILNKNPNLDNDGFGKGIMEYTMLASSGRVEAYIHNDSFTQGKGGVIVKITCESDFAAKTDEFIEFCKSTARLLYAIDINGPVMDYDSYIMEIDSDFKTRHEALEEKLKEKIEISDVVKMTL